MRMIELQFKDALSSAGLNTRDNIIGDGTLRRFQVDGDKPNSKNGWYVLFNDSCPSGAFGSWKTGESHKWSSKGYKNLNHNERNAHSRKMVEARKKQNLEQQQKREQARHRANTIWSKANDCHDMHPYLVKKNVKAHGLRLSDNKLIIPMRDSTGTLHSIQTIDENGNKRFLSGGRKQGCFHTLGTPQSKLNIVEGYATGATLYEVTGIATVVAFDAGNLIHVAKAWRSKYPALEVTICADNDTQSPQNIGVIKAKQTALAISGSVAIPPCHGDFNDFYNGINL